MKVIKVLLLALVLLAVAAGLAVGGIYMGWFPVPEPLIESVAKAQGLSDHEAGEMARIVNLYRVVKTTTEAQIMENAIKMAQKETTESEWKTYVVESWPQISEGTLERIRTQLQIEEPDFQAVTAMLDARIAAAAAQPESLEFTRADLQKLKDLDAKYGFSELFRKFSRGTASNFGR